MPRARAAPEGTKSAGFSAYQTGRQSPVNHHDWVRRWRVACTASAPGLAFAVTDAAAIRGEWRRLD